MTQWSYLGVDILTGAVLADLPLSGVKFGRVLNGFGSFTATLSLLGLSAQRCSDLADSVDCGRRALYVLADGQPVWGGPIWSDDDAEGDVLSLQATEWGGYFAKRVLRSNLTYTATDQFAIARGLVSSAQAVTGGNVRVALGSETSSVLRDRSYLASGLPVIGEQLSNLANVVNGFDYAWSVEYASGVLQGRLQLGYPTLGVTVPTYVVQAPKDRVRSTAMGRSAADMATTAWAVGTPATSTDPTPYATSTDAGLLAAGYPVLDKVTSYQDVTDTTTLQAHADADQDSAGGPLVAMKATVPIADYLQGLVNLGDAVRVERHARRDGVGFTGTLRVTQVDLDPDAQIVDLTLSPRVTTGGRVPTAEDDQDRLARLQRELRLLTVAQ